MIDAQDKNEVVQRRQRGPRWKSLFLLSGCLRVSDEVIFGPRCAEGNGTSDVTIQARGVGVKENIKGGENELKGCIRRAEKRPMRQKQSEREGVGDRARDK